MKVYTTDRQTETTLQYSALLRGNEWVRFSELPETEDLGTREGVFKEYAYDLSDGDIWAEFSRGDRECVAVHFFGNAEEGDKIRYFPSFAAADQFAQEHSPTPESRPAPTLHDILILASLLPGGLDDDQALAKLNAECDELTDALAAGDIIGALTEAADAVYYCVKYLDWVGHRTGLGLDNLIRVAAAKYELRAGPDNPKDDAAEREAVAAALTCETLSYAGLGEEAVCGKQATHLFDQGRTGGHPVCAQCAAETHPSRLTPIVND